MSLYTHAQTKHLTEGINALPDFQRQVSVMTGTDNMAIDAIGINDVKSSATYSDSLHSKHSKTLQNIAKQGGNVVESKSLDDTPKSLILSKKRGIKEKAAMGFEPMNIGFANQRLSPLGHAAVKLPRK